MSLGSLLKGLGLIGIFPALVLAATRPDVGEAGNLPPQYSAKTRIACAPAYLLMPHNDQTTPPMLLSQTGAFEKLNPLTPAAGLIPYDVNLPFWSDASHKVRWIALPESGHDGRGGESKNSKIKFSEEAPWEFPDGTVFVKHFEFPAGASGEAPCRIETRLLVRDDSGGVYGATYRWRVDGSDADLINDGVTDVVTTGPKAQPYAWYFPGRSDCRVCHTPQEKGVLGVNTRQLNRSGALAGNNQLLTWNALGLFDRNLHTEDVSQMPRLRAPDDESASLEVRARSYLDVNCAMCHQPGGVTGNFDARFSTPLARQNLVDGHVRINLGLDHARVIAPHDPWRSIALSRLSTLEKGIMMPPLAHEHLDKAGVNLLKRWIVSMPGDDVLSPPRITPGGGSSDCPVSVSLEHEDSHAVIHYTTDGTPPTTASAVYKSTLLTTHPVTIRASAWQQGKKPSIIVQQTYVITKAQN